MEDAASETTDERLRVFRSLDHPGDWVLAAVFGRSLVQPLAATTIPIMLVGLVLVLQGNDPLSYISWSFPLAFAVAAAWTSYRLRSAVVEIQVAPNGARALSAYEACTRSTDANLQRVFDVREGEDAMSVTIGLTMISLERTRWPKLAELEVCLRQAREYYA